MTVDKDHPAVEKLATEFMRKHFWFIGLAQIFALAAIAIGTILLVWIPWQLALKIIFTGIVVALIIGGLYALIKDLVKGPIVKSINEKNAADSN